MHRKHFSLVLVHGDKPGDIELLKRHGKTVVFSDELEAIRWLTRNQNKIRGSFVNIPIRNQSSPESSERLPTYE